MYSSSYKTIVRSAILMETVHTKNIRMKFLLSVVLATGILYTVCDCCFPFPFSDPCQNVTCPYGQTCNSTSSYYCGAIFCQPVAICSSSAFPADPCMLAKCSSGFTCVAVVDQCTRNGTLCKLKAQCSVSNRPGSCPDSATAVPNSCMFGMGCDIGFDARCPTNTKCCLSQTFQNTTFCLPQTVQHHGQ
ncbi:hypothetical protein RvY_04170 [Ramazzottius varieornatus]|uniref:Uncharacterized protein n=1 Tax=Ramazzottius varieornatus TaxID=947166 RepID=A0A1D1URE1_RAMVA|nr:hypothetical protein RvY_04170 [Ramazzottius varieornatus]